MFLKIFFGIIFPLIGTTLGGAIGALFCKKIRAEIEGAICCFAGGVMTAASVFSLIIPAVRYAEELGNVPLLPVSVGFTLGAFFIFLTGVLFGDDSALKSSGAHLDNRGRMLLAVTVHNFPEGMAVGVAFAGLLVGGGDVNFGEAIALSFGIALQNLPEGAIISLPLRAAGVGRVKAFFCSFLSIQLPNLPVSSAKSHSKPPMIIDPNCSLSLILFISIFIRQGPSNSRFLLLLTHCSELLSKNSAFFFSPFRHLLQCPQ